jgi:hypothetical protein
MTRLSPHPSRHAPLPHATAFPIPVRLPPHTQPKGRPALWPIPPCPFEPCYSIPSTGPPPSPHTANRNTCLMAQPAMSLGTSREHLLEQAVSLPAMQRLLQPQLMSGGSPFGERRYIYVCICFNNTALVAQWSKHWAVDPRAQGSSSLCSILFASFYS